MKIAIICSLDFSEKAGEIKKALEKQGHVVSLPYTVEKILAGEMTLEKVSKMKKDGRFNDYVRSKDLIRWNWERMKQDDAVLVINGEKKGIRGYIGGNTFLEMGLAYVNHMKVFLWDQIPNIEYYSDEMRSMNPMVINGNIDLIK